MVDHKDVGWGKYSQYEGPFFTGNTKFKLPDNPNENYKRLAVITATEGGHYNAHNGYDRCVCTHGLIQWCEAGYYFVSDMLGDVFRKDPNLLDPLTKWTEEIGVEFKINTKKRFRFFFKDHRGEVDRLIEQKQLFLLKSSGLIGSWDENSKQYSKKWAASIATVFEQEKAQEAQIEFTSIRLRWFLTQEAKDILFREQGKSRGEDWIGAIQAAYTSFSANLPAVASNQLVSYVKKAGPLQDNKDWAIGLLKELTFGPNIAIYPGRYNKIRPVVEKLYNVNLPDFAAELKAWEKQNHPELHTDELFQKLKKPKGIQEALLKLHYDLGPRGADGVIGEKTMTAIKDFQRIYNLNITGNIDVLTREALYKATT